MTNCCAADMYLAEHLLYKFCMTVKVRRSTAFSAVLLLLQPVIKKLAVTLLSTIS